MVATSIVGLGEVRFNKSNLANGMCRFRGRCHKKMTLPELSGSLNLQ